MPSCFSISAGLAPDGLFQDLVVQGHCFVPGSNAEVEVSREGTSDPTMTQVVPVSPPDGLFTADGTFSATFTGSPEYPLEPGTYNIVAYDEIGRYYISPMTQLSWTWP